MFIMWGTKDVRKYLGRRADFCPLCREIRPMRRARAETVGHFYYLPLGTRTSVGLMETCESCGLVHEIPETDQSELTSSRRADLQTLIEETNVDVRRTYRDELNLASRLKNRETGADSRRLAIKNTLSLADLVLGYRLHELRFDRMSGLALIGAIAAPILLLAFRKPLGYETGEEIETIALIMAVVLGMMTAFLIATDARRYARNRIKPVVVRALAPLDPPVEELQTALDELRDQGSKLGKYLKASSLRESIDRAVIDPF